MNNNSMNKIIGILFLFCTTVSFAQNVEFTKDNFLEDKDALKIAKKEIAAGDVFFYRGTKYYREAIDHYLEANTFKLRDAEGEVGEFTARDPANLAKAAIGDAVVVTTTEAMAIEVIKATVD